MSFVIKHIPESNGRFNEPKNCVKMLKKKNNWLTNLKISPPKGFFICLTFIQIISSEK